MCGEDVSDPFYIDPDDALLDLQQTIANARRALARVHPDLGDVERPYWLPPPLASTPRRHPRARRRPLPAGSRRRRPLTKLSRSRSHAMAIATERRVRTGAMAIAYPDGKTHQLA